MPTDNSWALLSIIISLTGRVYNKPERRMTLEGILYRMRTGIPWRELPKEFGDRNKEIWSEHKLITLYTV